MGEPSVMEAVAVAAAAAFNSGSREDFLHLLATEGRKDAE